MKRFFKQAVTLLCVLALLFSLAVPAFAAQNDAYFRAYTGSSGSIVTALQSIGEQSSYSYRAQIAQANGISYYCGTAQQNITMLNLLKQGRLLKPGATVSTQTQTQPKNQVQTKVSVSEAANVSWFDAVKKAPVRATPYETGAVQHYAAKGSALAVTGKTVNRYGNTWYLVSSNGTTGYIYAGNVRTHSHSYQSVTYDGITYKICNCGRVTVTYKTQETVKVKQADALAGYASAAGLAAAADGPIPAGDLIGAGILLLGAYYYMTGAGMNATTSMTVLKELDFDDYISKRENVCSDLSFRMVTKNSAGLHYMNDRCLNWAEAYVYARYMKGDVYTTYASTAAMLGQMYEGGCYMDRDGGQPTYFYHYHFGTRSNKVGGHIFFGYNDFGQGPT